MKRLRNRKQVLKQLFLLSASESIKSMDSYGLIFLKLITKNSD